MKTHVLLISQKFPAKHPRKGELTNFYEKTQIGEKLHTCRANFKWWWPKIAEVSAGMAVLSVRSWSGKPYNSNQVKLFDVTEKSGIGFEMVSIGKLRSYNQRLITVTNFQTRREQQVDLEEFAYNDGLTVPDFNAWFGPNEANDIIIHFTEFRYTQ